MKISLILLLGLVICVNAGAAQVEIDSMMLEDYPGFSPYGPIKITIDSGGYGTCKYRYINSDSIISIVELDNEFLSSLKDKFHALHEAHLDSVKMISCVDCGKYILSYKIDNHKYSIMRNHLDESEFLAVNRMFRSILMGEMRLHEFQTENIGNRESITHFIWEVEENINEHSIYKPERLYPYLEKYAADTTLSLEMRLKAGNCLPAEWNWNYHGLKVELVSTKKDFRLGKPINMTLKLTNIRDTYIKLPIQLGHIYGQLYCAHDDRCQGRKLKKYRSWIKSDRYIGYYLRPGETVEIGLGDLNDHYELHQGPHELYMVCFLNSSNFDQFKSNTVKFNTY